MSLCCFTDCVAGCFLLRPRANSPSHSMAEQPSDAASPRGNSASRRKGNRPPRIPLPNVPMPVSASNLPSDNLESNTDVLLPDGKVVNIQAQQLTQVSTLGKGAHGVVERMQDPASQLYFAVKKVPAAGDNYHMEQQLREMNINQRTSDCPSTVLFYGAMQCEGEVYLLMELMDVSLDVFYKKVYEQKKVIPEVVLQAISYGVVSALKFMKEQLKTMHRDVKPSNILADRSGQFKVCDFGIAGNLVNSFARTHVGTQVYMAPERITPDAQGYTAKSDVWSLGVTLYELATGACPFPRDGTYFSILQKIVNSNPPELPDDPQNPRFSAVFKDFVSQCLVKEVDTRPNFDQLLQHDFLRNFSSEGVRAECADFICSILDGKEQANSD